MKKNISKKIGFTAMLTGGLAAATIGLAGPAAAMPVDGPMQPAAYSYIGHDIVRDVAHDVRHDVRQIRHDVRHDVRRAIWHAVDGGR
ncbi:MAG: hypothetical protein AB7G47_06810 [Mycolicibacterium sp.]|uniref:hypothetical protein n=1 Tax=Mycolicibacterium sp. TaxID=2320850 RepID=UPI003D0F53CF